MRYLFLLFFSISIHSQVLHHQMLSSQGSSSKTSNGILVKQTIGQLSTSGNYDSDNLTIGQGFQQSNWQKYIAASKKIASANIITFPNPFIDIINFQFGEIVNEVVSIYIFDVSGRIVFRQTKQVDSNILSIDLSSLPRSGYLIRLKSHKINYYTKILKNL